MKTVIRGLGALVLGGLILATAACDGPPPKPVGFNDRIAKSNKRLYTAARAFRKKLEPLQKGTPVSPATGQQAWDALDQEVQKSIKESQHMPLPYRSGSASAFLQAYQDYLNGEDAIMQGPMKRVVATLNDQSKPPAQQWQVIEGIFAEVDKMEAPKYAAVKAAQQAFGDEQHISPQKQP